MPVPLYRALLIQFAIAVMICAALFLFTGDRRYLGGAARLFNVGLAAALASFAVLMPGRIV